jgi:hypothetical protein
LPSINANLEWLPNLFVSGGLADLELGPFARNIMLHDTFFKTRSK